MSSPARDTYFYLSHAHGPSSSVDHWVQTFYDDLYREVQLRARPNSDLDIGFLDDLTGTELQRQRIVSRALNAARVFVPLYSAEYFAEPTREWTSFRQRMSRAGAADTVAQHIQPVLWSPITPDQQTVDLDQAYRLGEDFPEYAEFGLSAMCRLSAHATHYNEIVRRLATGIVEVAERSVLAPTMPRTLADPPRSANPEVPFIIAVIAPHEGQLPQLRQAPTQSCYGARSVTWRPYRTIRVPIADHACEVARRFSLPAHVVDFATGWSSLETSPGVILVDPWVLAHDDGQAMLRAAFAMLRRQWVNLIIVVDENDPQYASYGRRYATRAMQMGGASTGHKLAQHAVEFDLVINKAIPRTRRYYLTRPPPDEPDGAPI